jgi:hypothetical protein
VSNLKKGDLERSLPDAWTPPLEAGRPVAALASTFEFDADFYERELIGRFLGCERDTFDDDLAFVIEREQRLAEAYAAVLVDISHVAPVRTSPNWDQIAVHVPSGRLHAKIAVLAWEDVVRLTVTSANLTPNGYRSNHEIALTLDFWNQEDSPPRSLLITFLDELANICAWGPPRNPAVARVVKLTNEIRNHVLRWRRLPTASRPLAKAKLIPILVRPSRPGARRRQLFAELAKAIGGRKFDEAYIMSPFFDEPAPDDSAAEDVTAQRLLKLMRRTGKVYVVCRGAMEGKGKPSLQAPDRLRETLTASRGPGRIFAGPVILHPGEQDGDRLLHAKALWLYDKRNDVQLLVLGSSNFTKAGTGSGRRTNIEANLALITRGAGAETRAIDHIAEDIIEEYRPAREFNWQGSPDEDEAKAPEDWAAPPFMVDATYDIPCGRLDLTLASEPPPSLQWALTLADQDQPSGPLWSSETRRPKENHYEVALAVVGIPTAIAVTWQSPEGSRRALMPIVVADRTTVPQPDSICDLSFDELVEFLASGQEPWDFIQKRRRKGGNSGQIGPDLDPHKLVDKSRYLTVRTRLFSQAIAALRERLADGNLPTAESLLNRLFGAFGPWALAQAIVQQSGLQSCERPSRSCPLSLSPDLGVFFLSELCLMLRWIGPPTVSLTSQSTQAVAAWNKLLAEMDATLSVCSHDVSVSPEAAAYAGQVLKTAAKGAA